MSILTIDDHNVNSNADINGNDSNVLDSDAEFVNIVPSSLLNNFNQPSTSMDIMPMDTQVDITMPRHLNLMSVNNDIKPSIDNIVIQNSSDITFGNKTFYRGPVTIKQYVYDYDVNNERKGIGLPSLASVSENDSCESMNDSTGKFGRTQSGKF